MSKLDELKKKLDSYAEDGFKKNYPKMLKLSQEIDNYITDDAIKQFKRMNIKVNITK